MEPQISHAPPPVEMPTHATIEKRRHERQRLEVEVDFSDDTNLYTGLTQDISTGGLFVATWALRPLGALVDLRFQLPNDHVVEVTGEVRWRREPRFVNDGTTPGMGIAFLELSGDDRAALEEFMRTVAPIYHDE